MLLPECQSNDTVNCLVLFPICSAIYRTLISSSSPSKWEIREFTKPGRQRQPQGHLPQSKSCFRTLHLIYHPEGQNKAPYNSEMPETDILTLKTNIKTTEFYFAGLDLLCRSPEMSEKERKYWSTRQNIASVHTLLLWRRGV